jgi:hypothetical protein
MGVQLGSLSAASSAAMLSHRRDGTAPARDHRQRAIIAP